MERVPVVVVPKSMPNCSPKSAMSLKDPCSVPATVIHRFQPVMRPQSTSQESSIVIRLQSSYVPATL